MAIFELTPDRIREFKPTTFSAAGLKERGDLQRLLRSQIEIISPDTLVISEEFGEWDESKRRIDLLGIDKDANLVVIELKRTDDGGHMDLQAIRYAAMVSAMTFERAVEVYASHLERLGTPGDARAAILDFLDWEEADEDRFAQDVRIVLVAADFSKELTTAVMWLNERDLDIRCIRLKPYGDNGRVLVDVQQVVPLPEAADYIVSIKEKEVKERKARKQQWELGELLYRFWAGMLEKARKRTDLHGGISPLRQHWIGASAGRSGISFNYAFGHDAPRVELYFQRPSKDENKSGFDQLFAAKAEIEGRFGGPLGWERMDENKTCRIKAELASGSVREETTWPQLQDEMIGLMMRFADAIGPNLQKIQL